MIFPVVFSDLLMWICAFIFLTGLIFVFEIKLSNIFGFSLLLITSICFAMHFWAINAAMFGIMFAVFAVFAIRFLIGSILNSTKYK